MPLPRQIWQDFSISFEGSTNDGEASLPVPLHRGHGSEVGGWGERVDTTASSSSAGERLDSTDSNSVRNSDRSRSRPRFVSRTCAPTINSYALSMIRRGSCASG